MPHSSGMILARAAMALLGAPVTQIAMLAGYDNVAAFTTMFTRRLGTSPRAYMRRSLAG